MATHQCYNKGCGKKFNPDENTDSSCQFHPGQPVFHDALKGWSCCNKRSTDFTEFLNFKGCMTGPHSNVKPPEPEKPAKDDTPSQEVIVVEAPKQRAPKPTNPGDRPAADEPMQTLKVTIGATLKAELEKLKLEEQSVTSSSEAEGQGVSVGTQCKNSACKCTYLGPESNEETCQYHPGFPIFHEGMKYWTCCNRKTSDFDNFLNQEGCATGKHVWVKSKEQQAAETKCRVDWHQTGSTVCVSIFAKAAEPEKCSFEANKVTLKVFVVFGKGSSVFQKTFHLRDLAQPIRLLLNHVGQKFDDVHYEQGDAPDYSREAWTKVKGTLGLDFPNLPYYIDGDLKLTQSNAILRHIARKHNLAGKSETECAYVDMMLENAMDLRNTVVGMVYNPEYEKLIKEYQPKCKETLAGFEKWLSKRKWFAGDKVTVADFPMYELLDQHRLMIPGVLDAYPKLTAFMNAFEALPKIKEYMASDKFMKRPVNNKIAKFK